eukprot:MONOS_3351.1-p1 / transcript=MONOS_3351.1 / gene=MONOS_3351 / organism=Monocercomonoides_exilis_PA203 / gene_product=unspecified product / transcript_product=unspecified product / location=Mono_scaffold00078:66735-70297(+) / protein_length=1069 / sequence_SO=supercontig / SO=protein_coding / is_pseudo=false
MRASKSIEDSSNVSYSAHGRKFKVLDDSLARHQKFQRNVLESNYFQVLKEVDELLGSNSLTHKTILRKMVEANQPSTSEILEMKENILSSDFSSIDPESFLRLKEEPLSEKDRNIQSVSQKNGAIRTTLSAPSSTIANSKKRKTEIFQTGGTHPIGARIELEIASLSKAISEAKKERQKEKFLKEIAKGQSIDFNSKNEKSTQNSTINNFAELEQLSDIRSVEMKSWQIKKRGKHNLSSSASVSQLIQRHPYFNDSSGFSTPRLSHLQKNSTQIEHKSAIELDSLCGKGGLTRATSEEIMEGLASIDVTESKSNSSPLKSFANMQNNAEGNYSLSGINQMKRMERGTERHLDTRSYRRNSSDESIFLTPRSDRKSLHLPPLQKSSAVPTECSQAQLQSSNRNSFKTIFNSRNSFQFSGIKFNKEMGGLQSTASLPCYTVLRKHEYLDEGSGCISNREKSWIKEFVRNEQVRQRRMEKMRKEEEERLEKQKGWDAESEHLEEESRRRKEMAAMAAYAVSHEFRVRVRKWNAVVKASFMMAGLKDQLDEDRARRYTKQLVLRKHEEIGIEEMEERKKQMRKKYLKAFSVLVRVLGQFALRFRMKKRIELSKQITHVLLRIRLDYIFRIRVKGFRQLVLNAQREARRFLDVTKARLIALDRLWRWEELTLIHKKAKRKVDESLYPSKNEKSEKSLEETDEMNEHYEQKEERKTTKGDDKTPEDVGTKTIFDEKEAQSKEKRKIEFCSKILSEEGLKEEEEDLVNRFVAIVGYQNPHTSSRAKRAEPKAPTSSQNKADREASRSEVTQTTIRAVFVRQMDNVSDMGDVSVMSVVPSTAISIPTNSGAAGLHSNTHLPPPSRPQFLSQISNHSLQPAVSSSGSSLSSQSRPSTSVSASYLTSTFLSNSTNGSFCRSRPRPSRVPPVLVPEYIRRPLLRRLLADLRREHIEHIPVLLKALEESNFEEERNRGGEKETDPNEIVSEEEEEEGAESEIVRNSLSKNFSGKRKKQVSLRSKKATEKNREKFSDKKKRPKQEKDPKTVIVFPMLVMAKKRIKAIVLEGMELFVKKQSE